MKKYLASLFVFSMIVSVSCTTPDMGDAALQGADGADGQDGRDGQNGINGKDGVDGEDGESCKIINNTDGSVTISCPNGTATVSDGNDGENGGSCTVVDNGDGTATLSCPDGSSVDITLTGGSSDADSDADSDSDSDVVCCDGDLQCGTENGKPVIRICENNEWRTALSCSDSQECRIQNGDPTCVDKDPCDNGNCNTECDSDEYDVNNECVECVYNNADYPCKDGGYCSENNSCVVADCSNFNRTSFEPQTPSCASGLQCWVTGRVYRLENSIQTGWRLAGICGKPSSSSYSFTNHECWDPDWDGNMNTVGGTCEGLYSEWSPPYWSASLTSKPYCQGSTIHHAMAECCPVPGACGVTAITAGSGRVFYSKSYIK